MSLQPVLGAIAGPTLLRQQLTLHEWLGITIFGITNAVAVATIHDRARP